MLFSPSDYRLIDQYNADMFALLPFYPFACKGELEQIENDPQNRKKLVERLRWIITGLGHAAANGKISPLERRVLLDAAETVALAFTHEYPNTNTAARELYDTPVPNTGVFKRLEDAELEGRAIARKKGYSGSYLRNYGIGFAEGHAESIISVVAGIHRKRGLDEDGILYELQNRFGLSRKGAEAALRICESGSSPDGT